MIDNMVDENHSDSEAMVVSVGGTEELGKDVRVVTPEFNFVARSFHDMPGNFVMEILMTPPPMVTAKKISLMKLAMPPEEARKMELASFNEAYDAMQAWIAESNVKRVEREQKYDLEDAPMLPGLSDFI